tara:strand:+ start:423 stop:707 length:285 start_codon:yes stop_codon:yes gene_type:complete
MSNIVVIHPKELSDIRGEIADLTGRVDAAGDCDITSVDLQQNEAFRAVGRHLYQHIEERYEPAMDKLNRRLQSIENAIAEIRGVEYDPTDFEST